MDTTEFLSLLQSHDWYYSYSDDHRVWTKGTKEWETIQEAMKDNPTLTQVYQSYIQEKGYTI